MRPHLLKVRRQLSFVGHVFRLLGRVTGELFLVDGVLQDLRLECRLDHSEQFVLLLLEPALGRRGSRGGRLGRSGLEGPGLGRCLLALAQFVRGRLFLHEWLGGRFLAYAQLVRVFNVLQVENLLQQVAARDRHRTLIVRVKLRVVVRLVVLLLHRKLCILGLLLWFQRYLETCLLHFGLHLPDIALQLIIFSLDLHQVLHEDNRMVQRHGLFLLFSVDDTCDPLFLERRQVEISKSLPEVISWLILDDLNVLAQSVDLI